MSNKFPDERQRLDDEWAKLESERAAFDLEKKEFEAERDASGVECKVFVGNLAESTTKDDLEEMFGVYGALKEVIPLTDRNGNSKKSCFLKFYSKATAEKCIRIVDGKIKDNGCQEAMAVRFARDKVATPAMGNMGMGAMGMNHMGMQQSGNSPYVNASFQQQQATQGYGGAHSDFGGAGGLPPVGSGGASAGYYGQVSGYSQFGGGGFAGVGGGGGGVSVGSRGAGRGGPGCNLYVNNLQPGTSEDDLYRMFSEYGTIMSTKVFSQSGFDHSYGFVSFDNAESATTSITMLNGISTGNTRRPLEVSLKKEKSGGRFSPY